MKDSLFHLRPEQLAILLGTGAACGEKQKVKAEALAETLRATLDREIPLDATASDSLPAVLGAPCTELLPHRGRSLGEVLLDSTTSLAALTLLKEYAKELVRRNRSDQVKAATTAIYYASIAAAVALHDTKITGHGYEELASYFSSLVEKSWLPANLKGLIERAAEACRVRASDRKPKEKRRSNGTA